jgi:hypothetical protein
VIGTADPGTEIAGTAPMAAITPTKVAVMAIPAAENTRCLPCMSCSWEEGTDRLRLVNLLAARAWCPDQTGAVPTRAD